MDTRQLIRKALRGRDISLHGSIGFNRSAERLEALGPSVLPLIEEVINALQPNPSSKATGAQEAYVGGLASVLQTYFKLGARAKRRRSAEFLRDLPPNLREEALRRIFFLWGPVGASQGVAFPSYLLLPLAELMQAGSSKERNLSRRLLEHLIQGPRRASRRTLATAKA
jgi:hypothetical protein